MVSVVFASSGLALSNSAPASKRFALVRFALVRSAQYRPASRRLAATTLAPIIVARTEALNAFKAIGETGAAARAAADREEALAAMQDMAEQYVRVRASAVGFEVLGQLAERTPVLFFTHHSHLVDVAGDIGCRRACGEVGQPTRRNG